MKGLRPFSALGRHNTTRAGPGSLWETHFPKGWSTEGPLQTTIPRGTWRKCRTGQAAMAHGEIGGGGGSMRQKVKLSQVQAGSKSIIIRKTPIAVGRAQSQVGDTNRSAISHTNCRPCSYKFHGCTRRCLNYSLFGGMIQHCTAHAQTINH